MLLVIFISTVLHFFLFLEGRFGCSSFVCLHIGCKNGGDERIMVIIGLKLCCIFLVVLWDGNSFHWLFVFIGSFDDIDSIDNYFFALFCLFFRGLRDFICASLLLLEVSLLIFRSNLLHFRGFIDFALRFRFRLWNNTRLFFLSIFRDCNLVFPSLVKNFSERFPGNVLSHNTIRVLELPS